MYFLCKVMGVNYEQSKKKATEELMLSSYGDIEKC